MPDQSLLSAIGLEFLELGNSSSNMYLAQLDRQQNQAAQQSSQVAPHWQVLEERLMRAEVDIQRLKETCHKLELYLEQYELINQELATQVIDLQTRLKAT